MILGLLLASEHAVKQDIGDVEKRYSVRLAPSRAHGREREQNARGHGEDARADEVLDDWRPEAEPREGLVLLRRGLDSILRHVEMMRGGYGARRGDERGYMSKKAGVDRIDLDRRHTERPLSSSRFGADNAAKRSAEAIIEARLVLIESAQAGTRARR